ncbi:MAG TPA: hypothetical protein PKC39_02355 [Ferruginibacter sp.]|nr:hypothetical protein [Ferruginibacter sp.]HMP19777.1 hypothetical protein [Ferruginibacter sp.]
MFTLLFYACTPLVMVLALVLFILDNLNVDVSPVLACKLKEDTNNK